MKGWACLAQGIMRILEQGLSTGAPDLTANLPVLVQRLQGIISAKSASTSTSPRASHQTSAQPDIQARARKLLALVGAVDKEVYM